MHRVGASKYEMSLFKRSLMGTEHKLYAILAMFWQGDYDKFDIVWLCEQTNEYKPYYLLEWILRLWQYGLWSFQAGGTKLERFLHKNQHTQMKLLNSEFWINGELSKIGHYLSNKKI